MPGRMLSKIVMLTVVSLVAAMVVAACGGGSDPTAAPSAPETIVHTPTPLPTATVQVIVQTATPVPAGPAQPTPTAQVIVQTATPGPTPTPAPTAEAMTIVQTATPTPTPNIGAITQEIKGWRPIQGNGLEAWRVPPQRGGTFVYGFAAPNRGTDLVRSQSFTVAIAATPPYNSIARCTPAIYLEVGDIGFCEAQGDLATAWTTSDGGKTWNFTIAEGVKWQTPPASARGYTAELSGLYGRDLTTDDIVHSTKYWRSLLPDQPTAQGNAHFTAQIEDVVAVDDSTVSFILNAIDPNYPTLLADWRARIFPPEVFEMDGDYTQRTVGTGPLVIDQYDAQVEVSFVANADYFKAGADGEPLPYLDGYNLLLGMSASLGRSAMITGQIDFHSQNLGISTPSSAVNFGRQCPDCTIVESFQPWRNFSLGFRTEGPDAPFADPKARLAIAKAIDVQGIIDNVFEGAARVDPVFGAWGTFFDELPDLRAIGNNLPDDENPYVFDPDVAQRLWAESGHSTGEEHEIIYYQYGVANTNNVQAAANDLRNNLGIEVSVNRAADIGTFYTAIGYLAPPHQQFSSMTLYVQGPRAAPSAWAGNLLGQGAANLEDRNNPVLEGLVAEWKTATDEARIKEITREFYAEVINDFRNFGLPTPAVYHVESQRTRNLYEFRLAGIQLHQGGWHLEYIWLAQ